MGSGAIGGPGGTSQMAKIPMGISSQDQQQLLPYFVTHEDPQQAQIEAETGMPKYVPGIVEPLAKMPKMPKMQAFGGMG